MTNGSATLKLDEVMRLCGICGTALPADRVQARTDLLDCSCKLCGSLAPGMNSPDQIAQIVGAVDPRQLRAERLRIIKDFAAIEQERRRARDLDRERDAEIRKSQDALRAAFLASIGAVPVPLTFYAVWLDALEREAGRKARASERLFSESEFTEYGKCDRSDVLYSWHRRCWLATIPFRRDEMLPLYGSSQLALFLPPTASAEFLQDIDERDAPLLGHSSVQGLQGRGRSLHTWSLGDKPFPPTAYVDVNELRSKRLRMRTLRRTWAKPLLAAAAWHQNA